MEHLRPLDYSAVQLSQSKRRHLDQRRVRGSVAADPQAAAGEPFSSHARGAGRDAGRWCARSGSREGTGSGWTSARRGPYSDRRRRARVASRQLRQGNYEYITSQLCACRRARPVGRIRYVPSIDLNVYRVPEANSYSPQLEATRRCSRRLQDVGSSTNPKDLLRFTRALGVSASPTHGFRAPSLRS